jgi:hypothetical protein
LHTFNFGVEKKFDVFLEAKKGVFNFRFGMEKIGPGEFCEIIYEANVVFKTTSRRDSRAPNIGKN